MRLTINISDNATNKAVALIQFLKTLDFVTITQEDGQEIIISDEHKKIVLDRIKSADKDSYVAWEDIEKKLNF